MSNKLYNILFLFLSMHAVCFVVATTDDSPVAMKLKKMWLKTPITEEQASLTILDPSIGKCLSLSAIWIVSVSVCVNVCICFVVSSGGGSTNFVSELRHETERHKQREKY